MMTLKELNGKGKNEEINKINFMSNEELVKFYLDYVEKDMAPSTLDHYRRHIKNFMEFIEDFPIKEIQPFHIKQWLDQREQEVGTLKPITKKLYIVSISSFFNYLKINGYKMDGNPALVALKTYAKNAKSKQYEPLTLDQIKKIVTNTVSPRDRAIIMFLFKTGCRISECTNMKMKDIDLEKNIITIRNRKAHSEDDMTMIPIDSELSMILKNWIYFRPKKKSDHLFVSYYGQPMTVTRMRDIVVKCGEHADIPKAHSHRYRYSFTTVLSDNGCNLPTIAYLRGDSPKNMVEYYTKSDFENKIRPEYLKAMPILL